MVNSYNGENVNVVALDVLCLPACSLILRGSPCDGCVSGEARQALMTLPATRITDAGR